MNIGKTLIAAIVGGIAYFLLGWLIWGTLLQSTFALPEASKCIEKPFNMVAMLLSCIISALLVALIYGRWANIKTFSSGAMAGAVIGALMSLTVNLSLYAMYNFVSVQTICVDAVASAVSTGIVGGIIGWLLGSKIGGASS